MNRSIALWVGVLVASYVGGRLYGLYTVRYADNDSDGDDERTSRATYRFLAVVGVGTGLALAFSGLPDAAETALTSLVSLPGGLARTLVWMPTFACTIIVVLVTYLGVFPYARRRRNVDITAATAVARLARYLVALAVVGLGAVALYATLVGASEPSPLLIPVVFAALAAGLYVWSQYGIRLSQEISAPTADQQRHLEAAADEADLSATLAGVFPGRETEAAGVYLSGPVWNRRWYATDYAIDALEADELAALYARAAAADDLQLPERQAFAMSALFGLFVTLSVWASLALALVGLLVAWPLLARYLQRCEFAADHRAARTAGAQQLAAALETGRDLTDDRGRLSERLASTPSTARRLERLRT